jgi:hypothetical protein
MHMTHAAIPVDQHGRWHRVEVVRAAHLLAGVQQDREAHAELLCQAGGLVRILVDVDRQHREARGAVLLVQAREMRHLLATRTAPARPEVDHHHPAALLLQPHVFAAEARQREVRRAGRCRDGGVRAERGQRCQQRRE